MGKVIKMGNREKAQWSVLALCMTCMHRWAGLVHADIDLMKLQCPNCGEFDSFASFIPRDYLLEAIKEDGKDCEH